MPDEPISPAAAKPRKPPSEKQIAARKAFGEAVRAAAAARKKGSTVDAAKRESPAPAAPTADRAPQSDRPDAGIKVAPKSPKRAVPDTRPKHRKRGPSPAPARTQPAVAKSKTGFLLFR